MSQITEEQVKHVALLSKLEFSENEVKSFTDTFGKIIDMVEMLDEVDGEGVPFTMNVADNLNFMREDVAEKGLDRENSWQPFLKRKTALSKFQQCFLMEEMLNVIQ